MLRLAGFSAGTGVGARGGWAARVGFGMRNSELGRGDARVRRFWRDVFPRFAPGIAALMLFLGLRPAFAVLLRIALGLKQALLSGGTFGARFICPCGSVAAFDTRFTLSLWVCRSVCLGSRLLFDAQRQTGRLAICSVPVPQVEIAIRAFSRCRRGYQAWLVHFGIVRLFAAISTGCRGRGNGAGGAGFVRFLRGHIGAVSLSAGSTLGLNVEAALRPLFGG